MRRVSYFGYTVNNVRGFLDDRRVSIQVASFSNEAVWVMALPFRELGQGVSINYHLVSTGVSGQGLNGDLGSLN